MGFCYNCGKQVRDDMRYCPDCGADLKDETGAAAPARAPRAPVAPAPQAQPYPPMGQYPFPMYYKPPMPGKRLASVSGAIILTIDSVLALLLSLIILIDWWDVWVGFILLGGAAVSIVGAVAMFLSFNPTLSLVGPPVLILGAIAFWIYEPFAFIVSIIGGSLAAISLILFIVGWEDSISRYNARTMGIHPSMAGSFQGMPYGGPPAYGGAQPPSMLKLRK